MCLYCVIFLHRDLDAFLTIEGCSCLSTNSKALILVNRKFKKNFLKTSQFGNNLYKLRVSNVV